MKRPFALGVGAALLTAVVIGVGVAADGVESAFHSDAPLFRRVALEPFGYGSTFEGAPDAGAAYRYGRILYPLTAWMLAGGQPGAVSWTLLLVHVLAIGALIGIAADMCLARGRAPERAVWLLASPSLLLVLPIAVVEPFATALVLGAYRLGASGRWRTGATVGALAVLAREAMFLALLPLAWRAARERAWARAMMWSAAIIPWLGWSVWVRARVGDWPFTDPAIARREALAPPFLGPVRAIGDGVAQPGWLAAALVAAGLTIAVAAWVWVRARDDVLATGALVFALSMLLFGRWVWRFPGDALRVMMPAQALTIVALAARERVRDPARYSA